MFADVSDEELAKYDKFIQGIAEGEQKQNELLQDIQVCVPRFLECGCCDAELRSKGS